MWKWLTILLLLSPQTGIYAPASPTSSDPIVSCAPPNFRALSDLPCAAPGPATLNPASDGRYAPVFPGWGRHHYSVSTSDDSAQFYFDQGLNLYYSYHLTESAASFREAQQKDSRCAMAYWGEALAMGPYYNSAYVYKMPPDILSVR